MSIRDLHHIIRDVDMLRLKDYKKEILNTVDKNQIDSKIEPKINSQPMTEVFTNLTTLSSRSFHNYGSNWVKNPISPNNLKVNIAWSGLALSSSGQYQTAIIHDGYIYNSSDFGATWIQVGLNKYWSSVGMSADAAYQTAVDVSGNIYRSIDLGITWTYIVTVDSTSDNYICVSMDGQIQSIAVKNGYIYNSSDFGATWTGVTDSQNWSSIACSYSGENQTATVYDGTIYNSNNYGVTWSPSLIEPNKWKSIAMSSTGEYRTVLTETFGIGGFAIHVSSNYGSSFESNNFLISGIATSNYIDSTGKYQIITTDGGFMYNSDNFGVNWTVNQANVFPLQNEIVAIKSSESMKYQSIISSDNSVFRSEDGGITWTSNMAIANNEDKFNSYFTDQYATVAVSSDSKYQSFVINKDCIYISNNYGETFTQNTTLGPSGITSWLSIDMSSDGKYQSACGFGIVATSNNYGGTWSPINSNTSDNLFGLFGNDATAWNSISVSSSGQYQIVTSFDSKIFISSDYGKTWISNSQFMPSGFNTISVASSDNFDYVTLIGYQGGDSTKSIIVFVSSDGGKTFSNLYELSASLETPTYLNVSPSGQYQAFTTHENLYLSGNYGIAWVVHSLAQDNEDSYINSVYVLDDGTVYVTEFDGYIHKFQSLSWTTLGSPSENWCNIVANNDNLFAISGGGILWKSSDNGLTWSDSSKYIVLFQNNNLLTKIAMSSSGQYQTMTSALSEELYTANAGLVFTSNDYGNTWVQNYDIPPSFFISIAISSTGQYQIVAAIGLLDSNMGVFVSSNFGTNWTKIDVEEPYWLDVAISSSGKIMMALTINYHLYKSCDYGATWKEIDITNVNTGVFLKQIMMSANGEHQTLATLGGSLYNSRDYGETWVENTSFTGVYWLFGGISHNGQYQTYTGFVGFTIAVFTSSDYGVTWIPNMSFNYQETLLYTVNMNATGQYQTIVGLDCIYNSSDYGNTFQLYSNLTANGPTIFQTANVVLSLCCSASGDLLTSTDIFGNIYSCRNYEFRNGTNYKVSNPITDNFSLETNYYQSSDVYKISSNVKPITIILPQILSLFPSPIRTFTIVDYDGNAQNNNITIKCNSNDTISPNGNPNTNIHIINTINANVTFTSDGANRWFCK